MCNRSFDHYSLGLYQNLKDLIGNERFSKLIERIKRLKEEAKQDKSKNTNKNKSKTKEESKKKTKKTDTIFRDQTIETLTNIVEEEYQDYQSRYGLFNLTNSNMQLFIDSDYSNGDHVTDGNMFTFMTNECNDNLGNSSSINSSSNVSNISNISNISNLSNSSSMTNTSRTTMTTNNSSNVSNSSNNRYWSGSTVGLQNGEQTVDRGTGLNLQNSGVSSISAMSSIPSMDALFMSMPRIAQMRHMDESSRRERIRREESFRQNDIQCGLPSTLSQVRQMSPMSTSHAARVANVTNTPLMSHANNGVHKITDVNNSSTFVTQQREQSPLTQISSMEKYRQLTPVSQSNSNSNSNLNCISQSFGRISQIISQPLPTIQSSESFPLLETRKLSRNGMINDNGSENVLSLGNGTSTVMSMPAGRLRQSEQRLVNSSTVHSNPTPILPVSGLGGDIDPLQSALFPVSPITSLPSSMQIRSSEIGSMEMTPIAMTPMAMTSNEIMASQVTQVSNLGKCQSPVNDNISHMTGLKREKTARITHDTSNQRGVTRSHITTRHITRPHFSGVATRIATRMAAGMANYTFNGTLDDPVSHSYVCVLFVYVYLSF